jgi:Zn-dependent peptidase ImmA (M78 family)
VTSGRFEEEAAHFARRAWESLKLSLPVDLDRVAERLGIVVNEREFDESIDGLYLRLPGAPPVIAVNSSYVKPLARRRFTLAHEIGHHLLSRDSNTDTRLFFFDTLNTRRTFIERACDRFAALLLMPDDLVRAHYSELEHNPTKRVAVMAERFGVSTWALRRRLRELGLQTRQARRR